MSTHYSRRWQAVLINWWVILSCGPNSSTGILPQGVGMTTSDEASGVRPKRRDDGQCAGLSLGFRKLSEEVPPEWQMENYVSRRSIPKAPWATRRNQTALFRLIPESSGFCRCSSHFWNQNFVFQVERCTMQNMSRCSVSLSAEADCKL